MIVYNPIINIGIIAVVGILLCVLTVVTYWKVSSRLQMGQRLFLLGCRLLGCALLILILLQPSRQLEEPLTKDDTNIGIAIDTSKSMLQNDMDGKRRIDYAKNLITEKLSAKDLPVNYYSFDEDSKKLIHQF